MARKIARYIIWRLNLHGIQAQLVYRHMKINLFRWQDLNPYSTTHMQDVTACHSCVTIWPCIPLYLSVVRNLKVEFISNLKRCVTVIFIDGVWDKHSVLNGGTQDRFKIVSTHYSTCIIGYVGFPVDGHLR